MAKNSSVLTNPVLLNFLNRQSSRFSQHYGKLFAGFVVMLILVGALTVLLCPGFSPYQQNWAQNVVKLVLKNCFGWGVDHERYPCDSDRKIVERVKGLMYQGRVVIYQSPVNTTEMSQKQRPSRYSVGGMEFIPARM